MKMNAHRARRIIKMKCTCTEQARNVKLYRPAMTMDTLSDVAGGGKSPAKFPSKPIADLVSSALCGGHDWVRTGKEAEVPFLIFWTKHQREYRCSKCGKVKWETED